MNAEKKNKFYRDGIRFECQGSGKCCTARGEYGYVYLSYADRKRLAFHLGMPPREFTRKYTEKTDGYFHLKDPDQDCPFFQKRRCMVYDARPHQCRTWPFWPENMERDVWGTEVASFCPGVGKGRLYSYEEIGKIVQENREIPGLGK